MTLDKCINYEYCGNLANFNDQFCLTCYKAHELGYNQGYNEAIIQNLID